MANYFPTENINEYFILAIQKDYSFLVEHILSLDRAKARRVIERECRHEYGYDSESKTIKRESSEWLNFYIFPAGDRIDIANCFKPGFVYKEVTTALNIAVENNSIKTVKLLLSMPKIDVNQMCVRYKYESNEQMTPLHTAIANDNYEIVELLCQHQKIDVNIKSIRFAINNRYFSLMEKMPPIHLAIYHQNESIVSPLSNHQGIDINAKYILEACKALKGIPERLRTFEYTEITPLNLAVEVGNTSICKSILSNKNININCETIDCIEPERYSTWDQLHLLKVRLTPLHAAIFKDNTDICELLLSNNEIDVSHFLKRRSFLRNCIPTLFNKFF